MFQWRAKRRCSTTSRDTNRLTLTFLALHLCGLMSARVVMVQMRVSAERSAYLTARPGLLVTKTRWHCGGAMVAAIGYHTISRLGQGSTNSIFLVLRRVTDSTKVMGDVDRKNYETESETALYKNARTIAAPLCQHQHGNCLYRPEHHIVLAWPNDIPDPDGSDIATSELWH